MQYALKESTNMVVQGSDGSEATDDNWIKNSRIIFSPINMAANHVYSVFVFDSLFQIGTSPSLLYA